MSSTSCKEQQQQQQRNWTLPCQFQKITLMNCKSRAEGFARSLRRKLKLFGRMPEDASPDDDDDDEPPEELNKQEMDGEDRLLLTTGATHSDVSQNHYNHHHQTVVDICPPTTTTTCCNQGHTQKTSSSADGVKNGLNVSSATLQLCGKSSSSVAVDNEYLFLDLPFSCNAANFLEDSQKSQNSIVLVTEQPKSTAGAIENKFDTRCVQPTCGSNFGNASEERDMIEDSCSGQQPMPSCNGLDVLCKEVVQLLDTTFSESAELDTDLLHRCHGKKEKSGCNSECRDLHLDLKMLDTGGSFVAADEESSSESGVNVEDAGDYCKVQNDHIRYLKNVTGANYPNAICSNDVPVEILEVHAMSNALEEQEEKSESAMTFEESLEDKHDELIVTLPKMCLTDVDSTKEFCKECADNYLSSDEDINEVSISEHAEDGGNSSGMVIKMSLTETGGETSSVDRPECNGKMVKSDANKLYVSIDKANMVDLCQSDDGSLSPTVSDDVPHRVQRSSSLKTGKTPPGTPNRKKIVRFADALGLDLEAIKTVFLDDLPTVPSSAFRDLDSSVYADADDALLSRLGDTSTLYSDQQSPVCSVVPVFPQPGSLMDFLDRLRQQSVCLESAVTTSDLKVLLVVRVLNVGFQKQVSVRYTFNEWLTYEDQIASYIDNYSDGFSDKFQTSIDVSHLQVGARLHLAIRYVVQNSEFWDNNKGQNYTFQCFIEHDYHMPPEDESWIHFL